MAVKKFKDMKISELRKFAAANDIYWPGKTRAVLIKSLKEKLSESEFRSRMPTKSSRRRRRSPKKSSRRRRRSPKKSSRRRRRSRRRSR